MNITRVRAAAFGIAAVLFSILLLPAVTWADSYSVNYTWSGNELVQPDRLWRDGAASSCATTKAYPGGYSGGPQGYVLFGYYNPNSTATCVTVSWTGDSNYNTFLSLYGPTYDPNNMATNYLGDSGSSASTSPLTFGAMVPANSSFFVLANTVWGLSSATGNGFSYTITGANIEELNPVPEPGTMLLFGSGLAGLLFRRLRR